MKTAKSNGQLEMVEFNSSSEMAEQACATGLGKNSDIADSVASRRTTWSEHTNAKDVLAMLSAPPMEIVRVVEELRERIEAFIDVPTQATRKRRHGLDSGDELDPIAWVQRDPFGWSDSIRERKPKRVIRIAVNLSISAFRRQADLVYRGAAAVALADILSSLGHDVELVAFNHCSRFSEQDMLGSVVLKASDQPMNISAVSIGLAHISYFRTVMLPALVRSSTKNVRSSLGQPCSLPMEARRGFDVVVDQDVFTIEQAIDTVRAGLRRAE